MKIAFFLKSPKEDKSPVIGRVAWDGQKKKFGLNIVTNPNHWDQSKQRFKKTTANPSNPELNAKLNSISKEIERHYLNFTGANSREPSMEEMEGFIDLVFEKKVIATKSEMGDFIQYYKDFISRTKTGTRIRKGSAASAITKGTAAMHGSTLKILLAFKPNLTFEKLDLIFYNDFISHLRNQDYSTNYIGRQIKNLKAVLSEAKENGLPVNAAFQSRYFANLSEETDAIFLSRQELIELEALDLSGKPKLEAVRDLFLIGCYTGQRFSDWGKIIPQNLSGGLFEISQQKNSTVKRTTVSIPIHPVVKRLFEKYQDRMPKPYSNQKTNDYLKEVCQLVPCLQKMESITISKGFTSITKDYHKWELVSTHTARRTFASIFYQEGVPTLTIMAITGHKTEKEFLKYIRVSNTDHAITLGKYWENDAREATVRAI